MSEIIEKAGTVYEDGSVERCVGFVFNKRVEGSLRFEPQVRQAMREYLERPIPNPFEGAGDTHGAEFVASNGVTVTLAVFDTVERPVAPEEVVGFNVIADEDMDLAEAELNEIANAKPNPRKTA